MDRDVWEEVWGWRPLRPTKLGAIEIGGFAYAAMEQESRQCEHRLAAYLRIRIAQAQRLR